MHFQRQRSGWVQAARAVTAAATLVAASAGPGEARTWTVDEDRAECPTADFTTLGAAVTAAASGDTIRLCPGLYRENVLVLNKSLTFQGDAVERVIIDGNPAQPFGTFPSFANAFTLRATDGRAYTCRFVSLTIRRGRYGIQAQDTETGGGRAGSRMTVDVSRCLFIHNGYDGAPYVTSSAIIGSEYTVHATDGGAIRGEGDDSRVADCQIEANDRGIQFDFGQRLQITGNQISGNIQAGIHLGRRRAQGTAASLVDATVRGNWVRDNLDAGIRISGGLRVTVEGNSIERNLSSGVVGFDCDTLTIRQNRILENSRFEVNGIGSFVPDAYGGVGVIDPLGPTTIADNDIRGNHTGLLSHTAGGIRVRKTLGVAVTISGNTLFANDGDGIALEGNGANVRINNNNITSNRSFGLNNLTAGTVPAERNWWASANGPRTGPATADNPEEVNGPLVVRPWATTPFAFPVFPVVTPP